MITIETLKDRNLLLFECISGSRAYGTDLPTSDTDIKGVFVLPETEFYGLTYTEQVNNPTNDIVYYELRRFVELLIKNNPNILEMLHSPADCILYKHPLFDVLKPEMFVSQLCYQTFAGYAMTQVQKARGLNKKILNPMDEERKGVLDFCYVTVDGNTVEVRKWLDRSQLQQEYCGLVSLNHLKNMYALYYDHEKIHNFRGIFQNAESNEVSLTSIPKGMEPYTYLYFNREGYSKYCKDYREYWEWVGKRNEERYQNTLQHGKNYDAKNMMHTIRLLEMAADIASQKKILVRRPNREYLLQIRRGEFSYEELANLADEKMLRLESLFEVSGLPPMPDWHACNQLLVQLRKLWYQEKM